MSQSTLPVRSTDPETSYAAAVKAALGASRVRPIVLDIVREKGPLTHDELIAAYHDRVVTSLGEVPRSSDSGLRTRHEDIVGFGHFLDGDTSDTAGTDED